MQSEILDFLQDRKGRVFSVKEVSKEVDEDLYERDRTWALGELKKLCSKGLIEAINGCYWIPNEEEAEEEKEKHGHEEGEEATLEGDEPTSPEPTSL